MSQKRWTLIDVDHNLHRDTLSLGADELGVADCCVSLRQLRGGLREGVDWLEVQIGPLRFVVLPTRGMGVWKAWLGDLEIGWRSPVRGPVHPKFVPIADPSGLGWLDGFDELICRCGLSSNGAPDFNEQGRLLWPLHGRIANLPAHHVELECNSDRGEIAVRGIVDECRFHFLKLRLTSSIVTRAGEPGFHIIDEVTNLSGAPGEMQLLYHINVGQPLLDPGSRVYTAFKSIAPRNKDAAAALDTWDTYGPPTPGLAEQVYFFEPLAGDHGLARVLLANAAADKGVSVSFPVAQLPHFILWKNTVAYEDGYVTGLEPAMNFPNPRSFEEKHGRVRKLAPGETVRAELYFEIHADRASVEAAEVRVATIQQKSKPTIHRRPLPDWSS
jgi:hypothetical protein